MKRVLLGGLSAGALTACAFAAQARVTTETYYTNDDHVPGAGYYHAPFRAFYPMPYNFYEPTNRQYFFGGRWSTAPHQSITNLSAPTPEVVQQALARRTDVPRSGFGSTSHSHSTWS